MTGRDSWTLQAEPLPGSPRIGFTTPDRATASAARQGLVAGPGSTYESWAVSMPDGTWAYWTAHNEQDPGWLLLPAGRVIRGEDWSRWEEGKILDANYPVIYDNMNCCTQWGWQIDKDGQLGGFRF